MRRLAACLLALSLAPSAGCATFFPPKDRLIRVTSFPEKATVRLDGEIAGHTPCFISVSHHAPGTLAFELEGHETLELAIAQAVNGKVYLHLVAVSTYCPALFISHGATGDATWRDDFAIAGGVAAAATFGGFLVDASSGNSVTHSTDPIHVTLRKREGR